MSAPYNAATVANRIIQLAADKGAQLTPMQIIKLTYIAHGFSLAINRKALLSEPVEAWKYGPVIPSLYQMLKSYGSGNVTKQINSLFSSKHIDPDDERLIDLVFEKYGKFNGVQLSHLTHRKGTPWELTYDPEDSRATISNAVIQSHYATLLSK